MPHQPIVLAVKVGAVIEVEFENKEHREFASKLLMLVVTLADQSIKQQQAARAHELRDYLSSQLKNPSGLSSAESLRTMLDQYQTQIALSALSQPMSADIIELPDVPAMPETPHYGVTLIIGFSISAFLTILYLYYSFVWKASRA